MAHKNAICHDVKASDEFDPSSLAGNLSRWWSTCDDGCANSGQRLTASENYSPSITIPQNVSERR